MKRLLEYRSALLEALAGQIGQLYTAAHAIPAGEWHTRRAPEAETPHALLVHIRDLEVRAYGPRFRRIVVETDPILEAYPDHAWSAIHYRADEPVDRILDDFALARQDTLNLMRDLPAEAWRRLGFHAPSGRRTAQWWAERMCVHVRDHLRTLRQ